MLTIIPTGSTTPQAIHFPAGEPHIAATEPGALAGDQVALLTGSDADELITLVMWAQAVLADGGAPHALIPYLPGARADRAPRLEAKVYADLINSAGFASVTCLDPHSPVMADMIERLTIVTAADMIAASLTTSYLGSFVGVIAPDEGAHERACAVGQRLDLPVFQARKHRDFDTGELTGFSCEYVPPVGDLLVVDDICDGGGTFIGLAGVVPNAKQRLHLWVSHGVFSGRAANITEHFASVMTTDSYPGCRNIAATVYPVTATMLDRLPQKGEGND